MQSKTDRVICGTCEYWTGNRCPSFDKNGVPKIDIIDKTGLCENQASRFIDQQRQNDQKCIHFSKWTEIL
ncbi:MAG: hypothetical protein Q4D50_11265 [Eubacteriales bacterium]|nr:hypothetical protein [Eubacteriales bacterium]